jgi:hypothetical protein
MLSQAKQVGMITQAILAADDASGNIKLKIHHEIPFGR